MSTVPDNSESGPSLARAWQLFEWRKHAAAREEVQKFLARQPEDAEAYSLLALCFSNEQKKRRALAAAREAVRLAPDQSNQHHVLGWVHMQFGQHRRSIAAFKNALRLAPDDPAIYDSLAAVFSWQGRYRTALRMAERGLKYDADHVGCHYRRAEALHGIGRHGEAEEALRTVLHQHAEKPQAEGFLGHYAAQRGDPTTALPFLRNALRTDADCTFMQSAWK